MTLAESATVPASDNSTLSAETPASSSTSQIDSLLKNKCEKVWERPIGPGVSSLLRNTYGDTGCKFPLFSPDENYLAYVTLSYSKSQTAFVDTVNIINSSTGRDEPAYFSNEKDFIGKIEWSSTGKLIIWELIWEGPWVIFIYDPFIDTMVYVFRLNQDSKLEWNPQHTIFYASHTGEYGHDSCVTELSGYDFQFNNHFPDFYEIYNLEEQSNDPFGIPYGKNDNLSIEPFAWGADGHSLLTTVARLTLLENGYYKQEPKQASVLNFSATGVKFTALGTNPKLNFFFKDKENPKMVSEPYDLKYCPTK